MPLITLHNKQGSPRVLDTADIKRYYASRFGNYTRVELKHELLDVQEDVPTIKRRIMEANEEARGV